MRKVVFYLLAILLVISLVLLIETSRELARGYSYGLLVRTVFSLLLFGGTFYMASFASSESKSIGNLVSFGCGIASTVLLEIVSEPYRDVILVAACTVALVFMYSFKQWREEDENIFFSGFIIVLAVPAIALWEGYSVWVATHNGLAVLMVVITIKLWKLFSFASDDYTGKRMTLKVTGMACLVVVFFSMSIELLKGIRLGASANGLFYILMAGLALLAVGWFWHLHGHDWPGENRDSLDKFIEQDFEKRIHIVNALTFGVLCVVFFVCGVLNAGNANLFYNVAALVVAFSIYHSWSLTDWPKLFAVFDKSQRFYEKFDLPTLQSLDLRLRRFQADERDELCTLLFHHFGYFYRHHFGWRAEGTVDADVAERIRLLVRCSSPFVFYGGAFYKVFKGTRDGGEEYVGLVAFSTRRDESMFYVFTSFIKVVLAHLLRFGFLETVRFVRVLCAMITQYKAKSDKNHAELAYIVIHPPYRRNGTAHVVVRALLEACTAFNRATKKHDMQVHSARAVVRTTNEASMRLFRSLGFVHDKAKGLDGGVSIGNEDEVFRHNPGVGRELVWTKHLV